MTRLACALALCLGLTATVAVAASELPRQPPGGPAPKTLLGIYRTTLTRADVAKAAYPTHIPTVGWELVVVNSGYLQYPRALGLRPVGQGGDTVPFGVQGNRINLQCLVEGTPAPGFGSYAFSVQGKTLRLRLLHEPCKERDLRNRIAIFTSEPWHKVR
jgi:hypothetical protein